MLRRPGPLPNATLATSFRPLPLLGNPHVQTVLSQYLPSPALVHPTQAHEVELSDGDRLVLHDSIPSGWRPGDRIALLLHGLGGCHASPHLQRLARLLLPQGLRVVRLDLRGAGHGARLARKTYHAGISDDVRAAAAAIQRWSPGSSLVVIGVSLGGNLALKLAGEAAADSVPGLDRVVAVGPPIDLERCAVLLRRPANRLYERFFVRALLRQLRQRQRLLPDLPPLELPKGLTLRMLDDLYTAPLWGFANVGDYYRRASALPLVPQIPVPTLILTARDDPFIAVEPFEELVVPPHVEVRILDKGGHLGFLGRDGAGGIRWYERRVAEWVVRG
jgi:predicted alpha/beta-fold hydrolase